MTTDAWSPDAATQKQASGYNPDKFYPQAGRNRRQIRIGVADNVAGEIAAIIASKVFPQLKTSAQFHHNALVHEVHKLNERMKQSNPHLNKLDHLLIIEAIVDAAVAEEEAEHRIADKLMRLNGGRGKVLTEVATYTESIHGQEGFEAGVQILRQFRP